ncbi:MAG: hypothetical protein EAX90_15495 [Candidatus Heimdallarchaeota archaeon]|nr:hypothetical protein [Candidatus Heimdallarchaeota archaeon]
MTTQEIAIDEKRKSLYNYWHKLPYFKTMDTLNLSQVEESEVSNFIIKYIRDGIEDEFGRTNNLSRRHAFSAKELHTAFAEKWKDQNYSLSNFHFHINRLVEDGYLQEIAKILEGRHYISYYGRTAISFIGQYDNILTASTVLETFEPIKQLIKNMNPEISLDTINQLVDENILSMQDFYYRLFSWIEDKYPLIYKSKIDIKDFLNIVSHFSFFHKEFAKTSKKIGSLLDFDKIMNYERYTIGSEKK